jgi:hypothetical protein
LGLARAVVDAFPIERESSVASGAKDDALATRAPNRGVVASRIESQLRGYSTLYVVDPDIFLHTIVQTVGQEFAVRRQFERFILARRQERDKASRSVRK